MVKLTEVYGIVSEIKSVNDIRLAVEKFEKKKVRKIISLGNSESSMDSVRNSYEFLQSFDKPYGVRQDFYFFGLNEDSRYLLENPIVNCRKMHAVDVLENKLKNGRHEIVFFDEDDLENAKNKGVQYLLSRLNLKYPDRAIVMSRDSITWVRDKEGKLMGKTLRDEAKVTKFVSASMGEPFGNDVRLDCTSHRMVWDVGTLSRGNCGVLNVYSDGTVGRDSIKFNPSNFLKYGPLRFAER